ncbi:MAG: flagellar basal-body rod protein FlgF, partial [Halanaerobiales bacterium]
MLRSMYSGVSGLTAHQTKLDVIGNNIGNVNTTGFKGSRVTFKEMLSQTLQGASAPNNNIGGTNPQQVGLGVGIGSIDVDHTQGNLQSTGKTEDLAIDGNGFFVVNDGGQNLYTRSGAMTLDDDGYLVNAANGYRVQGWIPNPVPGPINPADDNIGPVEIPIGSTIPAMATDEVDLGKNLNSEVPIGDTRTITVDVYDSLGAEHTVSIELTKTTDNNWEWSVTGVSDASGISGSGSMTFDDSTGNMLTGMTGTIGFTPDGGAAAQSVNVDLSQVKQYAAPYTVEAIDSTGYAKGELKSYSVNSNGVVIGNYSNGQREPLAQIAVASFNNPAGLSKEGGSLFSPSPNSGIPQVGAANNGGRGSILSGTLEMSNVDLAQQFTEMITAQRGFQ